MGKGGRGGSRENGPSTVVQAQEACGSVQGGGAEMASTVDST